MRRIFFLIVFLFAAPLFAGTNWDEWLRSEGYYLLSPEQKDKLKSLSDPEKEVYVHNLIASLDPSPVTSENEFELEYKKRYAYAKQHYSVPSDRAKVYILLGPPNSVESYSNSDKYYPMELWSYYSLGYKGLPPSLDLIFFRRWGTGDMKLYSPLFDGLKALSISQLDLDSPRVKNMLKAYFDASVVDASEHISTGYGVNESEIVRAYLTDPGAMQKTYQKAKPSVETTVVYEGFEADVYTYAVPYENDVDRVSVAVSISPRYLTFEKNEEKYLGRIDMIGRVTDDKGNEVLQINDSPAFNMSESQFEEAKAYFLSYTFDAFLLPGKYNFSCLYRDYVSNVAGKVEKSFEVMPAATEMELLPLHIAMKSSPVNKDDQPFGYAWQQYFPKENSTFNNGQTMVLFTELLNPKHEPIDGVWKLRMTLSDASNELLEIQESLPLQGKDTVPISRKMKLQSLPPGSYVAAMTVSNDKTILRAEAPIKIGTLPENPGRIRVAPGSQASQGEYHNNLALQYYYKGNVAEASRHARIALDFTPSSYPIRSLMARIEKAKGNTQEAITTYEKLLLESPADSEGFFLIGKWSMELQDWKKAEDMMKKAITLGYYTKDLLNTLAQAELQLGNKGGAVEYWEKSLVLDENQPGIRDQVNQYKQ